ncbi:MAG: neutral/alkaline non-lysosomal ceramidase N-terminal domain-containing protein [Dehalococcoidia bacterium]
MRIGAAAIDITPPVGTALDGYGGRTDVSLGVHDPLFARALYLDDGATQLALVVCDLIGIGSFLAQRARELIAERPGIPASNVMISATHTHAGPAGVRGRGEPVLVEEIARKIAGAVRVAHRNAVEGSLKYGHTELSSIAQNRRFPDGPIDWRLDVVAADTPGGRNIATIARYGCHATTLERDNLDITAEYPGEACRAIEQIIGEGATGIFLNGACGNINPAWIRQDYSEVRRLGTVVGAKAAALSQELRPIGINHQAHNIRWEELTHRPVEAGVQVSGSLKSVSLTFEAPYRTGPNDAEFVASLETLEREYAGAIATGVSSEDRRALAAKVTMARMERIALARVRDHGPSRTEEVQAFRLGENLHLVALPGEVFYESGEDIRRRSGLENLLVVAYANDYPGYFCRAEAYAEGGYEPGTTPFAPEADALLIETAVAALHRLT